MAPRILVHLAAIHREKSVRAFNIMMRSTFSQREKNPEVHDLSTLPPT
ncbi:MAG: hypothetical protein QE267_09380 [Akkermansiaceae bacterium]|nr:hypothetical protein [Akkermansiaceae bacterium]